MTSSTSFQRKALSEILADFFFFSQEKCNIIFCCSGMQFSLTFFSSFFSLLLRIINNNLWINTESFTSHFHAVQIKRFLNFPRKLYQPEKEIPLEVPTSLCQKSSYKLLTLFNSQQAYHYITLIYLIFDLYAQVLFVPFQASQIFENLIRSKQLIEQLHEHLNQIYIAMYFCCRYHKLLCFSQ